MATEVIKPPLPLFSDDSGNELENGYVYIGEDGLDPETNPTSVYWDKERTIEAAQPLRTVEGYISYNGSPSRVFISQSYSITVKDKKEQVVYTSLSDNFFDGNDVPSSVVTVEESVATEGQTVISTPTYNTVIEGAIEVFIDGIKLLDSQIEKTSSTSVTVPPLDEGDNIQVVVTAVGTPLAVVSAGSVAYNQGGPGAVDTITKGIQSEACQYP